MLESAEVNVLTVLALIVAAGGGPLWGLQQRVMRQDAEHRLRIEQDAHRLARRRVRQLAARLAPPEPAPDWTTWPLLELPAPPRQAVPADARTAELPAPRIPIGDPR